MDSKNILNHENLHFRKMKQIDMGMEETKKKKVSIVTNICYGYNQIKTIAETRRHSTKQK